MHGMMTAKMPLITRLTVCTLLTLLLLTTRAPAAEISIAGITAKPGQTIEMPIMIDKTDNLAGMKLVLRYDASLLTYKKSSKTKHSSSLMHIVNDKKPGILIIVMAGARGIKGKNFPIFTLFFQINSKVTVKTESTIKITESQLMSDKLKNIEYDVKISPLIIVPDEHVTPLSKNKK
jgi:hypothetical protein